MTRHIWFRRLLVFGLLLLVAAGGLAALRAIGRARRHAGSLCRHVECAMAPGETVFFDEAVTGWVLRYFGDAELRHQLRRLQRGDDLAAVIHPGEEVILVTRLFVVARPMRSGVSVTHSPAELGESIYFLHH